MSSEGHTLVGQSYHVFLLCLEPDLVNYVDPLRV